MSKIVNSLLRNDDLKVLNTESAKGFIVVVENKHVLKFCILSDTNKDLPELEKFTTTPLEFDNEVYEQNRTHRLTGICPPIEASIVLNNNNAIDAFWLLSKRCQRSSNHYCVSVFNQLQQEFNKDKNLKCGIIVMPFLTGVPLSDTKTWSLVQRRQILANCLKNVLSLYRNAQRVHGDLHETNIIVDPDTLNCQFIDFGIIEVIDRPVLGTVNKSYLRNFLIAMEPLLEFLSGDTTFYKIDKNRQRIYDDELLEMCLV